MKVSVTAVATLVTSVGCEYKCVICKKLDNYHNLEPNFFCKSWHFPVFSLLYIGVTCFLSYIECNGVPWDRV